MLLAGLGLVAGCTGGPSGPGAAQRPARVAQQGYYKIGQPYEIDGVTYVPAEDYNYDETGIASWYGPDFHGKITANGELYDMNEVTAAHKTLPMPCLVRVTNLDNGRTIVVRVNDRGPYARGRILDMSRRGAQLLGYEKTGTAKVRVQIMAQESVILAQAAKQGQMSIDIAGIDPNQPPPLPPATPAYTRPGPIATAPPPMPQYQPSQPQPTYRRGPEIAQQPLPPPPVQQPQQLAQQQYGRPQNGQPQYGQQPYPRQFPSAQQPVTPSVALVNEKALIQQELPKGTLKGSDVGGRFLPAPQVASYQKVRPSGIYIQAGAFGVAENAQRLQAKLAGVGKTDISQAVVDGRTFYRVRVGPAANVNDADGLLSRVVAAGANGAKIVVN
ncbi:MAG: lipoprotein [Rhodospirillales bacterium]|nr:lipoprotein [Rhodospirillales bacterium]